MNKPADVTARRHASTARRWAASLLAVVIVAAGLVSGWPTALYRYVFAPTVTVEIQYVGIACGSHLQWNPNLATVAPGTRVEFVNTTPYWTVPIKIAASSDLAAPAVAVSPPVAPAATWTHVFWQRGDFFLTSTQEMQQQAGLAGWLSVAN